MIEPYTSDVAALLTAYPTMGLELHRIKSAAEVPAKMSIWAMPSVLSTRVAPKTMTGDLKV
jgi:hypothetical protein